MNVRMEKMDAFKVVGKSRVFNTENCRQEIPKFWDESCRDWEKESKDSGSPSYGKYGICMQVNEANDFDYYIAGDYTGEIVGEGFTVVSIPAHTWAKFRCIGPMPGALQSVNTRIFQEWLPGNQQYEIADAINIEMYTMGDTTAADYVSEIWIPVKEK